MDKDCIFCKIIKGDISSYKVYEDDTVMAFLDVNPESNGHTLVVPKTHYQDIYDIDSNTLSHIFKCAKEISLKLTDKLNCSGITFIQNNGAVQEVKHFHLHIRPYYGNKSNKLELDEMKKILNN